METKLSQEPKVCSDTKSIFSGTKFPIQKQPHFSFPQMSTNLFRNRSIELYYKCKQKRQKQIGHVKKKTPESSETEVISPECLRPKEKARIVPKILEGLQEPKSRLPNLTRNCSTRGNGEKTSTTTKSKVKAKLTQN